MKIDTKLRNKLNRIVYPYTGWKEPKELIPLWDTLNDEFGIDIFVSGYPNSIAEDGAKSWNVKFDINGEPVDNSYFVYQVYEGNGKDLKNEYNMYFS